MPLTVIDRGKDISHWRHRRGKAMVRTKLATDQFELVTIAQAGHNFDAWFERNYDASATKLAYERPTGFLSQHPTAAREK